jgi:endo-1,4-beta-xylanase
LPYRPSTRRSLLQASAAVSLGSAAWGLGVPAARAQDAALPALRSLAAARGFLYGSDSDNDFDRSPAQYGALFLRQCALYAFDFNWKRVSPQQGVYDFKWHSTAIAFALQGGLKLTGGHFLWHQSAPPWFSQITDRGQGERAIVDFITRAASFYRGKVFSWNVSNEAINPREGRPDGLRKESPFVRLLGIDYLPLAFHAARAADPQAVLAYNEYDLELNNSDQEARRTALLRLLDYLQRQGAPIDAVGLQSHLKVANFSQFDATRYRAFLREIASRKLKILVTELDVLDQGAPADIVQRDRIVADIYARYLEAVLEEKAVKSVCTWGLSDRYTWLTPETGAKFSRSDGLPVRSLPFDAEFKPKPAFYAMVKAFQAAPSR